MLSPRLKVFIFFLFAVFCRTGFTDALGAEISGMPRGPRPGWVKPEKPDAEALLPASQISGGAYYILVDEQNNVETGEAYRHYAYKVVSEAGVQDFSKISFLYVPSYQTYRIHRLTVLRDGASLDWTVRLNWSEIQREENLSSNLYDGNKTVLLVLKDIRPGDLVEYEYSIAGDNPLFKGLFYEAYDAAFSYELRLLHLRILVPRARNLRFLSHNTDLGFRLAQADGGPGLSPGEGKQYKEYAIRAENVQGYKTYDKTPSWYYAYPFVEASEWKDWEEVKAWGAQVFEEPDPDGDANSREILEGQLAEFGPPKTGESLVKAIRFVQNRIRYFGVEIGINSHRPHPPAQVLDQRFGDCKDKALLLAVFARKLGYEAWPVLANTSAGASIPDYLPSPLAFDHAVVLIEEPGNEKRKIWVDATISQQAGTLEFQQMPDYGNVLVLDSRPGGLYRLPSKPDSGKTTLEETYESRGFRDPGTLKVKTTYSGLDADTMRYRLAGQSRRELQEEYLDFYRGLFAEAAPEKDLDVDDEEARNTLVVEEEYKLPDLWTDENEDVEGKKSKWGLNFYPYTLNSYFSRYEKKDANRTAPLYQTYPLDLEHRIVLNLHEGWDIEPAHFTSDNEFFTFDWDVVYRDRTLTVDYRYKTKTDHVPPAQAPSFVAKMLEIRDGYLSYYLWSDENTSASPGTSLVPATFNGTVFSMLLLLCLLSLGAALLIRQNSADARVLPAPAGLPPADNVEAPGRTGLAAPFVRPTPGHPSGLRGWLLVALGVLALETLAGPLCLFTGNYFDLEPWNKFTDPASPDYIALYDVMVAFELVFFGAFPVFSGFLLYSAAKRARYFPLAFCAFRLVGFALAIVYFGIGSFMPALDANTRSVVFQTFLGSLLDAAIWVPYVARSKRVANTFSAGRQGPGTARAK